MAIEEYCEELDAMLAANDEVALSLDEVHGFMSAALCGPRRAFIQGLRVRGFPP